MYNGKSLISELFDFSFTAFITTKLVKVLFVLAIIAAAILGLGMIVSGFSQGFMAGLGAVILAIIAFCVYVILARVWLEMIIVIFRIAENVSTIAASKSGAPAPGPATGGVVADDPTTPQI